MISNGINSTDLWTVAHAVAKSNNVLYFLNVVTLWALGKCDLAVLGRKTQRDSGRRPKGRKAYVSTF